MFEIFTQIVNAGYFAQEQIGTVEEPTPAKFEEVISQVSDAIVLDHQFDECDLTFSDLEKIRASFLKTLSAVHHHRIAYPGFDFDRSRPRVVEAE